MLLAEFSAQEARPVPDNFRTLLLSPQANFSLNLSFRRHHSRCSEAVLPLRKVVCSLELLPLRQRQLKTLARTPKPLTSRVASQCCMTFSHSHSIGEVVLRDISSIGRYGHTCIMPCLGLLLTRCFGLTLPCTKPLSSEIAEVRPYNAVSVRERENLQLEKCRARPRVQA
jgi:hypothetical protein